MKPKTETGRRILHYQLSWYDPGKADMPGVVAPEDLETARAKHPDPRMILGKLY
jgi:hypothetical protein